MLGSQMCAGLEGHAGLEEIDQVAHVWVMYSHNLESGRLNHKARSAKTTGKMSKANHSHHYNEGADRTSLCRTGKESVVASFQL